MVFEKSLTAMVKGIRAHRGKESEYINSCLQELQKEITSKNLATKSMAVLKLAYLSMLGYDMSWATFAVVEVMSHNRFAVKRPGYLASSISFCETTDVGLLTINLFKKDFGSKSQYECGLALSCLSSICSAEISRDIMTDLVAMLSSSRPYLRKKTILCLFRMFQKDPPALRTYFPRLKERLSDEDQGVLTATVNTFLELARRNARNYLSLVPQLYHILVNTTNNWLSIKLLKVFQLLCPLEPRLPAKMVEPLTNLLNTTKAQSVEFEAIRCTVRTMPDGTELMNVAMEKLQTFLKSSDRNLRFLALELFKEILEKPQFKDKITIPELHAKVLESIEESDTTARRIALQLLDRIVTPSSFADTVKKLMDFSKNSSQPDEFMGTILRMGGRDRYALLEDFAWYLLILAEIARNLDSVHATLVSEQMIDITVRVTQVRPYAVTLALSLLDRSATSSASSGDTIDAPASTVAAKDGVLDIAEPVVGACAWILGEYYEAFDPPDEKLYVRAVKALLAPKHIQALEPAIQTQCVWAASKLYLGSAKCAPGAVAELREILSTNLPAFIQSTHVDVAERASLALHLASFFKADVESVSLGISLMEEPLLPVKADSQAAVLVPEGLDIDEPFFPPEAAPQAATFVPVRADPADPYTLAATYKDDLNFLAAKDGQPTGTTAPSPAINSSMFYLNSSKSAAGTEDGQAGGADTDGAKAAASAPADPLEQMREKLMAARAGGGVKYEVNREDIQAPATAAPAAAAASSAPAPAAAPESGGVRVPVPPEKELTDLQGRLWSMCYRDDDLTVYYCIRSKNARKQQLRIDLRCERVTPDATKSVSRVALRFPAGSAVLEADLDGLVSLVPGELQERSAKVKVSLGLAPFVAPINYSLACEVQYSRGGAPEPFVGKTELHLQPSCALTPAVMDYDDVSTYMATHVDHLGQNTGQVVKLAAPGSSADGMAQRLPELVGRCAGLCQFYAIQQSAPDQKVQKFLLVAQPPAAAPGSSSLPGQEALPEEARIMCLCAGMPRDDGIDFKITVKSCRKDVCDDVCAQLASMFRELVEGRLNQ